ncbi:LytR/AlgR family response regulator transcription factor [Flavobacterium sp. 245]|uniref:LytR/AlgR family response regulator transcription factor n=1 Tax=Flavobacterium sp. 245 TaxID=2512115 RepID=UPI00105B6B83|nr:LytTR family DNA-binding domain-containing protein [Flavobacterium sp. 245]TDO96140.1 LytTR family two component transcriptional regulator [Flavobacterium sp. 245]
MNIYKAVIVDDEMNNILLLKHFISKYFPKIEIVAQAMSISEAVVVINDHNPDILFLDSRLRENEVFEVLDQIEINKAQLIFVSSHEQYAIKAIKYNAIDYILKPIILEDLVVAINKAVQKLVWNSYFDFKHEYKVDKTQVDVSRNKDYLAVVSIDKIELFKVSDVIFVESDSKYATFYLIDGTQHVSNKNLIHYEGVLDSASFFRIHKSYIINIKYTSRIIKKDGSYCQLVNGKLLPIAKRKKEEFNRFLKIRE